MEVIAINDLSEPTMLAYLLKYDSIQGTVNDSKAIAVYAERIPQNLPWNKHQVDLVYRHG